MTFQRLAHATSTPGTLAPPAIPRGAGRLVFGLAAAVLVLVLGLAWIVAVLVPWTGRLVLPEVRSISPAAVVRDTTPVDITLTLDWIKVPVTVPAEALLSDLTLWRRMHFDDWDAVPQPWREQGLDAMWQRFGTLVNSPRHWDHMSAADWDDVPQPVRAMAFIHMVRYWSGYYQVGARYGLPRRTIADTMAAIVMAESWFEHRAVYTNRGGDQDVGLGGASAFCRRSVDRMAEVGAVDCAPGDGWYLDPWHATRVVAIWFAAMLDESGGDLDQAIRSYHRGSPMARQGAGARYLANVKRLRRSYIRNQAGSPAWRALYVRAFAPR